MFLVFRAPHDLMGRVPHVVRDDTPDGSANRACHRAAGHGACGVPRGTRGVLHDAWLLRLLLLGVIALLSVAALRIGALRLLRRVARL